MAVSPAPDQTVTGRVTSVNPKGLKLDGSADWFNYSRFAPDIIPPMRGQTVTITIDRQGFVRSVDVTEVVPSNQSAAGATATQRDTTITRLAVLKAAAEYAASKPSSKSTDVLAIAAAWEQWVLRQADAGAD